MGSGQGIRRGLSLALCLLVLTACAPEPETPEILEQADYWTVTAEPEGGYRYTVTDGDAVLLEETLEARPVLSVIMRYGKRVIRIRDSGETWRERYVRLSSGAATGWLDNPIAASVDYAACLAWPEEERTAVVRVYDLWDGEPVRTFHVPFSEDRDLSELVDYAVFGVFDLMLIYRDAYDTLESITLDLCGPDWEDNPIDRFYGQYSLPNSSTVEINAAAYAYMEAWRAEAEHAYVLLAKRTWDPAFGEMALEARDVFLDYASRQAELEAWAGHSSAFDPEWDTGWGLGNGTGLPGFQSGYAADFYREQARRMYTQVLSGENLDDLFVFDADAYLAYLRDELHLTVEER